MSSALAALATVGSECLVAIGANGSVNSFTVLTVPDHFTCAYTFPHSNRYVISVLRNTQEVSPDLAHHAAADRAGGPRPGLRLARILPVTHTTTDQPQLRRRSTGTSTWPLSASSTARHRTPRRGRSEQDRTPRLNCIISNRLTKQL